MDTGRVREFTPRRWRYAFAVAVTVHLAVLYWPRAVDPAPGIGLDKVAHIVIFGMVMWAGVRAGVPVRPLLGVLLAHAVVSEAIQYALLPHRSGDATDSLADALGTLAAAWFVTHRKADAVAPQQ